MIIQVERIGERGVDAKEIEVKQPLDLELLHRAVHSAGAAAVSGSVPCLFRGVCCLDHSEMPLVSA